MAAATRLQSSLANAVYEGRLAARNGGLLRLQAELASIGEHIDLPLITPAERVYDARRAGAFARRYANDWLQRTDSLSKLAANDNMAWRLRVAATTETSEAFNDARSSALRRVDLSTKILKVWDAQLDKRTCRVCSRADGTIVAYNERFQFGEPGSVHANCRCNYTILTMDEAGIIEPAFAGSPVANI